MRLATQYDRIHSAGAELIAISVDDEVRQAGMAQRWGLPSTRFVSDPGGDRFLKPLGLFDPNERGGIGLTGLILIAPDGVERHRYAGRDFADRTGDEDVFRALEAMALPAIEPTRWTYDAAVPDDLRGYFRTRDLLPYFRGNMYGALAIGWRVDDPVSKQRVDEHRAMSAATVDALESWRPHLS